MILKAICRGVIQGLRIKRNDALQNPPRRPELSHGNEEVSVQVPGACVHVYVCGVPPHRREMLADWTSTSEMSFGNHLCSSSSVSHAFLSIKNGLQTGQSAVKKKWLDNSTVKSWLASHWQHVPLLWGGESRRMFGCCLSGSLMKTCSLRSPPICLPH